MLTKVPSVLPPDVESLMHLTIGACIGVHRHLGPGFLESVYRRAVCIELRDRGIPFEYERRIEIVYKGHIVDGQRLDLVVDSSVVLEVKAVSQLQEIHASQVVSYLKATGLRGGLLVNFNSVVLKAGIRRIVR